MSEFLPGEAFRHIVDELEMGVYIVDPTRKIHYWNRGAERIAGYLAQDVVGRSCRDNILVHCDDHNPSLCTQDCPLTEAMRSGTTRNGRVSLRHHAGHRIPVHVHVIPLRDKGGKVIGAAEVFQENMPVPDFNSQNLVYAACGCLDAHTGVPNRDLTESYLREQWDLLESHRIPFGVFVARVDHLPEFQAQHGHEAVLAMLSAVARTLRYSLRSCDFVGRWSEDCFLVMLPYSARTPLEPAVERLRNLMNCTAIPWWGDLLSVRVSAGLVKAEVHETLEGLKARIDHCLPTPGQPNDPASGAGA